MKQQFLELIDQIEDIEKLFHVTHLMPGHNDLGIPIIFDVQGYQIWKQSVIQKVQDIVDRTNDSYAMGTLEILLKEQNGWNDERDFGNIKGRLLAMKEQVDKYYVSPASQVEHSEPPKIFISHANKDKKYVEYIVSLLDDMGLDANQIFCSSLPGYDIPLNENIFDYLRKQFQDFNLHLIVVHSENYYQSSYCLNEMGAAWVHRNTCTSMLLPGFDFSQMTGVINKDTTAIKLDADISETKDKLNQLYETMVETFSLKKSRTLYGRKNEIPLLRL